MTTLDMIILAIIGLGFVNGLVKGFIKQLASLLGLVVGLLVAKALYVQVAEEVFAQVTDSLTVAQVLSFVLIWLVVPLIFALVALLLTRLMEVISLGWLNRLLGAGLGTLMAVLLVCLLIYVVEMVDVNHALIERTTMDESVFYQPMKEFAGVFFPMIKEQFLN